MMTGYSGSANFSSFSSSSPAARPHRNAVADSTLPQLSMATSAPGKVSSKRRRAEIGKAPIPGGPPVAGRPILRDAGKGRQQNAARREHPMEGPQARADIVEIVQRLSEEDAVEAVGRKTVAVASDRPTSVVFGSPGSRLRTSLRVTASLPKRHVSESSPDFHHPAANVGRASADERLDVVAIDRKPPVEAPAAAEWA